MRVLIMTMMLIWIGATAWAGSYTITTAESGDLGYQENTVQFFAARLGITATAALQQMCNAGILPSFQQRTQLDSAGAAQAFQQLSPADQATICTLFGSVGYACPPGP